MPVPTRRVIESRFVAFFLAALIAGVTGSVGVVDAASPEFPLGNGKLSLVSGKKPDASRIVFKGRWQLGGDPMQNPTFAGATLRVYGASATEPDSGLITLTASQWRGLGAGGKNGYRYEDPKGEAGGIQTVVLKRGKRFGVLRIVGSSATWQFAGTPSVLNFTFTVGEARWCAQFASLNKKGKRRMVGRSQQALASCSSGTGPGGGGGTCDRFDSTFQAIQNVVFERHGCTSSLCHGSAAQGGLDLRPAVAYQNLIDVPSPLGGMPRVLPGEQAQSFLWRKLAASTLGLAGVPGTPMPNGLPAISEEELEAIRLWIRAGAPETGVVANTETLLKSCLPPAGPQKIRPPAPPAVEEGIQLHAPPWDIAAKGENEVCYPTYYDFTAQIPASAKIPCPDTWGGPTRECFYYDRSALTQDPNSHHSIIHLYKNLNDYDITSDVAKFGPWTCRGGANQGTACNPYGIGVAAPAGADCGPDSGCAGKVTRSVACVFYGPPDFGFDITGSGSENSPTIGGSQQPYSDVAYPPEVFSLLPTKGVVVWNSHAFNLTNEATTNEQWLNLYFAPSADRVYRVQNVFDSRDIFVQNVPPFEKRTYCKTHVMPKGTRLFQFSSHTHKRAERFYIWGPGIATPCSSASAPPCNPEPGPPIFTTIEYNDPTVLNYDPPVALDGDDEASRTYKFCAVYDNGADNPEEVKRISTSPKPPFFLAPGGPCQAADSACVSGPKKGQKCNGNHAFCGAPAQALCDACPLRGGVTTEDEMFILLGFYYVVPTP